MNGTVANHMLYANDIKLCTISLSSTCLQQWSNICNDYCERHDRCLMQKRCMYFTIALNKHCGFPVTCVGNSTCRQFVKEVNI